MKQTVRFAVRFEGRWNDHEEGSVRPRPRAVREHRNKSDGLDDGKISIRIRSLVKRLWGSRGGLLAPYVGGVWRVGWRG